MRKSPARLLLFAVLFGVTTISPAFASGSYTGRPPQPPAKGESPKLDREKYGLGQKVYEGSATSQNGGDVEAQMSRLKTLQAKLPADAAKGKDLTAMAGKISSAQLEALEYFVDQRFAMKK